MSNQARLRILFNNYNVSSKATKNFINYFMNHAKLRVGVDTNGVVEPLTFTGYSSHEDDNYKFVITDVSDPDNVSDICIVSGSMSNSSTGESFTFSDNNNIFKLDKVDDNYELNIKSKQEFDTFELTVNIVPKYNETYAAIVQDNYSHTAGYNFQIPIQTSDGYKRGTGTLWHASVDRDVAIGMNFCQVLIEDIKDDDEIMLKLVNATKPDETVPKIRIEIYLNGELYAQTYDSQKTKSLYEDAIWPANILMTTFNQTNKKNGFEMQPNEHVDNGKHLGDFIRMYNYGGEAGYLWLNLDGVEYVDIQMQPVTDYLLTHNTESILAARLSNKEINSKLLAFKTGYEYDRDRRCLNTTDVNFNIPVSLKMVSESGAPLGEDILPYNKFLYDVKKPSPFVEFDCLPKSKEKVEYSLKTKVFTMSIQNKKSGETEIINAYYKLGVCALDGLDNSSEKLLNSFIKKCDLTVHQTDYSTSQSYMYYTFAIKSKQEYVNESKFYSVSEKFQFLDRTSTITDRNNLICSTSLRPIVEVNTLDQSKNKLLGVLYMDMFDADDDSIITSGWNKSDYKFVITVDGKDAIDQEIEITKI